ncbi:hypothetical protein C2S51_029891 [Perilla frutescens var. frutescens]|nr:hypothetical protein C2S51_029891 [Perilla frutescens var. frutescens]
MAAYAALVSLINDLDDIQNHPRHSFSFDNKQMTSLSQTLHFLIGFMECYDSHGCSTEALEIRITSAAHAAHDVIQSHAVDQIHAGSTLNGKARSYFLLDLQKAIDNVDFVWRKAMQFKAKSGSLKAEQPAYSAPASTSGKNIMVGFDAVRDQLLHILTGEPSGHRCVTPLVGMGGIGKTTLAKNAYEHLYIQQQFDIRLWATISQQYSVESILTQLIFGESRSTTGGNVIGSGEVLHKKLWCRRYLIVLDDMWSLEAWNEIQIFLPDNGNGSCVIVTTRLSNLATDLSSSPFEMSFLDKDKSWELFCGEAFGQEKCSPELEKIGIKIMKRCRGLPLSIIVIAGHLRKSSRTIEYWEKVGSSMNPISSSVEDEQCLKVISLSYHHLPTYLQPCFLYMGIYEEDKWIDASELVKFWIAEGFLKPNKSLSLEEVAEDYLEDLIDRNLILVREMSWKRKAKMCGIHDIVRELCLKVAKKEKFLCLVEDSPQAIGWKRHNVTRFPAWKHREVVVALRLAPAARSRVGRGYCPLGELSLDFSSLRLSAFQLVNLRHLHLDLQSRVTERYYILSYISLFWNVKTLIINNCCEISVSYEIWEMPQLRHLEFYGICLPDPLPNEEECIVLQNLHTLIGVEDFKLTEEVCKRMPNIKNLSVLYNHFPGDFDAVSHYCPHNLGRFNKLESLECVFYGDDSKCRDFVLSFTFPSSLHELSLQNSQLQWEDLAMVIKSLPHLEELELDPIKGLDSHFPILEILHIRSAPKLSEIPFDIGEISTLRRIELDGCSMSAAISAMRIVVEQESLGNEDLHLDVHFWKMEEVKRFQKMVQEEDLRCNSLCLYHGSRYHRNFKVFQVSQV